MTAPPGRRSRARRALRLLVAGLAGAVMLFYVAFAALLTATEREWLGRAPAHASIDVRSREPHRIELLDEGLGSLAARLRLMERDEVWIQNGCVPATDSGTPRARR